MDWSDDERWNSVLEDDYFIDAQMMAHSRQEALDLVGDDSFYPGSDSLEDDEIDISGESEDYSFAGSCYLSEDQTEMLKEAGLDPEELDLMDDDEIREALEDAGLDADYFE
ncbi:MAG: hypothetical protein K6G75_05990 [Lachnospiraceae bacterium]|nr:hypothetical protein [Lachnospiraceae bacterium]